jgi:hypothetical protein
MVFCQYTFCRSPICQLNQVAKLCKPTSYKQGLAIYYHQDTSLKTPRQGTRLTLALNMHTFFLLDYLVPNARIMSLSAQALFLAACYLVLFAIAVITTFRVNTPMTIAMKSLIPLVITIVLRVFDTNCLVMGGCSTYSWIRIIEYLVPALITMDTVTNILFQTYRTRRNNYI